MKDYAFAAERTSENEIETKMTNPKHPAESWGIRLSNGLVVHPEEFFQPWNEARENAARLGGRLMTIEELEKLRESRDEFNQAVAALREAGGKADNLSACSQWAAQEFDEKLAYRVNVDVGGCAGYGKTNYSYYRVTL